MNNLTQLEEPGLCSRIKTGALSNSETIVDGTSIAIAIISTFVLTAIAVSCLSAILGLVLHTHCNKEEKAGKKQLVIKLTVHVL